MTGPQTPPADELAVRRKRARRTALAMAAIAVAVYVGFIIAGTVGA